MTLLSFHYGQVPNRQTRRGGRIAVSPYEVNTLPSLTQPDPTLSLRQLLDRYTLPDLQSGRTPAAIHRATFGVDDIIPDGMEHFDDMQMLDYARSLAEYRIKAEAEFQEDLTRRRSIAEAEAKAKADAEAAKIVKPKADPEPDA